MKDNLEKYRLYNCVKSAKLAGLEPTFRVVHSFSHDMSDKPSMLGLGSPTCTQGADWTPYPNGPPDFRAAGARFTVQVLSGSYHDLILVNNGS